MHYETIATFKWPDPDVVCEELGMTPGEWAAMDGASKYDAFMAFANPDGEVVFEVTDGGNDG